MQRFVEILMQRLADGRWLEARRQARRHFSPALAYGRHNGPPLPSAKPAAVMLLIEPRDGEWSIPLTVRPPHLPDHPGQICLPGGRLEPGEDHLMAARREFEEEMGTPCPGIIVGELLPIYIFHSNYDVRPFLAVVSQPLNYQPCPTEVERLVHLPLRVLQDVGRHRDEDFLRNLVSWKARVISCGAGDRIWGATAILLGELSSLLKDVRLHKLALALPA